MALNDPGRKIVAGERIHETAVSVRAIIEPIGLPREKKDQRGG